MPPRTHIQESGLHQPANAPVERVPLQFITTEAHEFEQLIVRDELGFENLATEGNVLTGTDGYAPFWISHDYAATRRRNARQEVWATGSAINHPRAPRIQE